MVDLVRWDFPLLYYSIWYVKYDSIIRLWKLDVSPRAQTSVQNENVVLHLIFVPMTLNNDTINVGMPLIMKL